MSVDIRYFAWVRERVGTSVETIDTKAETVAHLIAELRGRSDGHAAAFADTGAIRAAVDQTLVDLDAPITGAREVAFFPPMTGG